MGQTIVANLLFPDDDMPAPASDLSPWLDFRLFPSNWCSASWEAQEHRRFIKTHTPLDGLPYFLKAKYICVSRDPRDVFMSLLNHWGNHTDGFYMAANSTPGRVGDEFPRFGGYQGDLEKLDKPSWFDWEIGGYPYWSHLSYALTFWDHRDMENIAMVHFNDLRADLDGEMRRIADYLEIDVPDEKWPDVPLHIRGSEEEPDHGGGRGHLIRVRGRGGHLHPQGHQPALGWRARR